ncbi:hypothetical protein K504DRAFT_244278 [Pleomassaria siparia CBS 279.74]|uniref:USP domain-containing protein n=1 Tax=Pleomassaria siparia CBS 279.74 TaxID=1314801 RepID=A0A6G1KFS4_9PLEO|nr:hypothetical protein K504DRAFT_244278 [Pleomassaria siparia CBS 279.74]
MTRSTGGHKVASNPPPISNPPRRRGPAPPSLQSMTDVNAAQIPDNWVTATANQPSRGIVRNGNTCFQIAAIQALVHLPLFTNWIREHNAPHPTIPGLLMNPCLYDANDVITTDPYGWGRCVACAVKKFVVRYWSDRNVDVNGVPVPVRLNDAAWRELCAITDIMYPPTRGPGRRVYRDQQDSEEYQTTLLQACADSVDSA